MILLGHKSTKYIFTYVQLAHIYFVGVEKYVSIWDTDRDQDTKASEEGYEYVRTDPIDGACLYRKSSFSSSTYRTRLDMTETHKTITPIYHLCDLGRRSYNPKLTSPRVVDPRKTYRKRS